MGHLGGREKKKRSPGLGRGRLGPSLCCSGQEEGPAGGPREGGGEGQAGKASPLSTRHCSTDQWSQAEARRRPGRCSFLRPAALGCGTCSHSRLWRRTWGQVGLSTVHPQTEGGLGGGQAADPRIGARDPAGFTALWALLCPWDLQALCVGPYQSKVATLWGVQ